VAEREIARHGFQTVVREDRFIDESTGRDAWWLIEFRRP
jgi:hypothetical protein